MRNKINTIIIIFLTIILINSCSYVYAPSYMLYYKEVGILIPRDSDINRLDAFIRIIKKYNLFGHEPKFIYGISHKKDLSHIDVLIIGIFPDQYLINKTSREIIGSWFDQGGKLIVFFNPISGNYKRIYDNYNALLDRIGSKVNIKCNSGRFNVTSENFLLNLSDTGEYTFKYTINEECIYYVTGYYVVGENVVGTSDVSSVHPLVYADINGEYYAVAVIETICVYSDLFTKVYSKVFLSMENPLIKEWAKWGNKEFFIEALSWGISPHTEVNMNGVALISSLILIGLSPYIYIFYRNRKDDRDGER